MKEIERYVWGVLSGMLAMLGTLFIINGIFPRFRYPIEEALTDTATRITIGILFVLAFILFSYLYFKTQTNKEQKHHMKKIT